MIGRSNREAQTESRANVADKNTSLNDINDTNQVNGSQVDMHTLAKNIVSKVRSEVDSRMTTFEARVQGAVMTAIENLVKPSVELAMKSVNASFRHEVGSVVLNSD